MNGSCLFSEPFGIISFIIYVDYSLSRIFFFLLQPCSPDFIFLSDPRDEAK